MSDLQKHSLISPWGTTFEVFGREGTSDENTLISCLKEDEYQIQKLPDVQGKLAIDLGSHIGAVSLALASKGYIVHAVEMFQENIDLALRNQMNNILTGVIKFHRTAVTGKGGEVSAYYANTSTEGGKEHEFIGTLVKDKTPQIGLGGGKEIKVNSMTLEELFKKEGIESCEFLKIDIEGSEWDVIRNTSPEILKKIKRIAVELEGFGGSVSTSDFLRILPKGFVDVSKEYFPKWSEPGNLIHAYFTNL